MTEFDIFYKELLEQIKLHEKKGTLLKIDKDSTSDLIKIFGENISALAKARNGINEVTELAYTTAEHHPFWNMLYQSSEIIQTLLEKWEDTLEEKDLNDISWAIKELSQTWQKIEETKETR